MTDVTIKFTVPDDVTNVRAGEVLALMLTQIPNEFLGAIDITVDGESIPQRATDVAAELVKMGNFAKQIVADIADIDALPTTPDPLDFGTMFGSGDGIVAVSSAPTNEDQTDWPQFARDYNSGDPEALRKHLPDFAQAPDGIDDEGEQHVDE